MNINGELLNEAQAAEFIGMSKAFLQKGRVSSFGYGPAYVKIGASIRYPRSVLEDYIQANTRQPEAA